MLHLMAVTGVQARCTWCGVVIGVQVTGVQARCTWCFDWCTGEVYLVFRNETRRHPLPDRSVLSQPSAVRRLFVECFPDRLSPAWFDSCYNRIYVLDHTSRVFYELDDLR